MKVFLKTFLVLLILTNISSGQSGWNVIRPELTCAPNYHCPYEDLFFHDPNTGFVVSSNGLMIKTTNAGSNWIALNTNTDFWLGSIYFTDINTGFAAGAKDAYGTLDTGLILKTTDGGNNWFAVPMPVYRPIFSLSFPSQNTGYAVGALATVLKTTDKGDSWVQQIVPASAFPFESVHFVNTNTGYVAGPSGRVLKTLNGGDNWVQLNTLPYWHYRGIHFIDDINGIVVGNDPANYSRSIILRTSDGGNNWSIINTYENGPLRHISFVNSSTGWITGEKGSILKTIDGGFNWYYQAINGSSFNLTKNFFLNENIGYIAGDSAIVLRTADGGGAFIGISSYHNGIPTELKLLQNYPNPFNPVTRIGFDLPPESKRQSVSIIIYDILGREAEILVNEILSPGTYEVTWDASNYPSGTYFCKLYVHQEGSSRVFSETKKMLLIK